METPLYGVSSDKNCISTFRTQLNIGIEVNIQLDRSQISAWAVFSVREKTSLFCLHKLLTHNLMLECSQLLIRPSLIRIFDKPDV